MLNNKFVNFHPFNYHHPIECLPVLVTFYVNTLETVNDS